MVMFELRILIKKEFIVINAIRLFVSNVEMNGMGILHLVKKLWTKGLMDGQLEILIYHFVQNVKLELKKLRGVII